MTGAINNLASSLAGAPASASSSAKAKANESFEKTFRRRRIKDEYNAKVEKTERIDTVRLLADADQEDAQEDRQEQQAGYTPYRRHLIEHPSRLDLNA
ncbi:MAG: hypothetical protein WD114_05900 [Phycisphaerales bacterium]